MVLIINLCKLKLSTFSPLMKPQKPRKRLQWFEDIMEANLKPFELVLNFFITNF